MKQKQSRAGYQEPLQLSIIANKLRNYCSLDIYYNHHNSQR